MRSIIHGGHVSPVRGMVEVLFLSSGGEDQFRSDPPSIRRLPLQLDLQVVMSVVLGLDIFVDECGRVDVVHHEIELAVVIEIGISGAIRKARLAHPPFFGSIGKCQISLVPEDIVRHLVTVQLLQVLQC